MKIRILGGGWYGCHLALALKHARHEVELHEIADRLFAGASGANPGRCHLGFHYPRSKLTRALCQEHASQFLANYGHLTRGVPVNIYAVADRESVVDFGTYAQTLRSEGVEFVTIARPAEFGLQNVEGAVLTGERHVLIDKARAWFTEQLAGGVKFGRAPGHEEPFAWDLTIDATFCANDAENIDRFEPCLTVLLEGPADRAITIMDGPFPSLYPWDEARALSSLTSALYTPLSKGCRSKAEARAVLESCSEAVLRERAQHMFEQLANYYPLVRQYRIHSFRTAVRAMPRSSADARLVDVVQIAPRTLRVRAGKIDAVFLAERLVREKIASMHELRAVA